MKYILIGLLILCLIILLIDYNTNKINLPLWLINVLLSLSLGYVVSLSIIYGYEYKTKKGSNPSSDRQYEDVDMKVLRDNMPPEKRKKLMEKNADLEKEIQSLDKSDKDFIREKNKKVRELCENNFLLGIKPKPKPKSLWNKAMSIFSSNNIDCSKFPDDYFAHTYGEMPSLGNKSMMYDDDLPSTFHMPDDPSIPKHNAYRKE